jgi:UDP-N-acetylglucosamine--N-acetylmuramyl-(pentapeptide) pyrophosphoryl-undecaprenol N-acetylglucosamine transferase
MTNKKIMIVGGGSGGHLTPVVAVAESLKKLDNNTEIIHVGQKGESLDDVVTDKHINNAYAITAGKFRRYHGSSFLSHLLDIKTILFNIRDLFRFMIGTIQAWLLLGRLKPDSIMLKGGFVCVPVGIAARFRRIPYLTHDSDAVPGLANRITAKHAVYNTTALPASLYPYDQNKTIQVGIPIRKEFILVDPEKINEYKSKIEVDPNNFIVFSVGGGLGAQKVNLALVDASKSILSVNKNTLIIHLTGKKLYKETEELYKSELIPDLYNRVKIIDFTNELFKYSSAADIIITRAGATNIAEFAAQAKPCIVVPAPHLTGGQQLHNAEILEKDNAAIVLQESELHNLEKIVNKLIEEPKSEREKLGKSLNKYAVYDSSDKLAKLLLEISDK